MTLIFAPRRAFAHPWLWYIERANGRFAPEVTFPDFINAKKWSLVIE